ncbi:MAG TPA: TetR/AcrR family transcriptional regulator [Chitinispirillaceae bacterium]|nr:TetR/AcrR family transcriptional regulator [Chitinispirillaceae bacterium]
MQVLKEKTRNTIIACAEQLFARKGFNSTTVDEIARNASISKGNLYLYFKNKKDLFSSVVPPEIADKISDLIMKRIQAVINPAGDKSAHNRAGEELVGFLIENRLKFLIMINPYNSSIIGPLRQNVIQGACNAYEIFRKTIKNGSSELPAKSVHRALITMLYDNLLTMIGQILCIDRNSSEYAFLLEYLFLYHYNGIISIPV